MNNDNYGHLESPFPKPGQAAKIRMRHCSRAGLTLEGVEVGYVLRVPTSDMDHWRRFDRAFDFRSSPDTDISLHCMNRREVPTRDSCTAAINHYSITWSASAKSVAVRLAPRACAVVRLIRSSKRVGC